MTNGQIFIKYISNGQLYYWICHQKYDYSNILSYDWIWYEIMVNGMVSMNTT